MPHCRAGLLLANRLSLVSYSSSQSSCHSRSPLELLGLARPAASGGGARPRSATRGPAVLEAGQEAGGGAGASTHKAEEEEEEEEAWMV